MVLRTVWLCLVIGAAALFGLAAKASADGYVVERAERAEPVERVYAQPVECCPQLWKGFYFGLNAGAGWANSDIAMFGTNGGGVDPVLFDQIVRSGQGSASDTAFIVGGQLGFNVQRGRFVLGLETDFNYFKIDTSRNVAVPAPAFNTTIVHVDSIETSWLYTLRPRVGFAAWPSLLIYATGGLALTNLDYAHRTQFGIQTAFYEGTDTKPGAAVGGGVEWMFDPEWTWRLEYLYLDFGRVQGNAAISNTVGLNTLGGEADLSVHMLRTAENFKF
jgi:outer membrane immunogenic protein